MPANMANVTKRSEFSTFLTPEVAQPIFDEIERISFVQQLATKEALGPSGKAIPIWAGQAKASWVAETAQKPITKGGFQKIVMEPKKIAAIFVVSSEVARENPLNYAQTMRTKVAEAFAKAFDDAALYGINSPFGAHMNQTTKSIKLIDGSPAKPDAYKAFNEGLSLLVNDGKKWTGAILDDKVEPVMNGSLDANGRPLFTEPTYVETNSLTTKGRILGRQALLGKGIGSGTTRGFMGDFSKIIWGQIGGITFDVSDQATLDLSDAQDGSGMVSLWQNNLVAVRAETEFGLIVRDPQAFVKVVEK